MLDYKGQCGVRSIDGSLAQLLPKQNNKQSPETARGEVEELDSLVGGRSHILGRGLANWVSLGHLEQEECLQFSSSHTATL